MKYLLNIILYFFPVLLLAQASNVPQVNVPKGIRIGMEVPADALGKTVDGKFIPAINELPQDLVILDFMTTSCTSCVAALPRFNNLQKANSNVLKIISISYEETARVQAFRKKNEVFKANKLDFVVEDSIWTRYFPHQTVSHMVWVYKGKVIAITFSEFVDQDMIDSVLKDGKLDLPVKNDFLTFDFSRPLMENNLGKFSFLTGFIEGAYTKFDRYADSVNNMIREYIVNAEIVPAFLYCYGKIVELPYIKDSRIIVERPDKERFIFDKERSKYRELWKRKYGISYEANFDLHADTKTNMKAMIKDMELKLGVKTALEPRPVMCWVIKDDPEAKEAVRSEDGQTIANFAFMLDLNGERPPVINESSNGYKYKFTGGSNYEELKVALKKTGFLLTQEERQIPCLVIK